MLLTDYDAISIADLKVRQADIEKDAAAQSPPINLQNKIDDALRQCGIALHQQAAGLNAFIVDARDVRTILSSTFGDYIGFRFSNQRVVLDDAIKSYVESTALYLFYDDAAYRVGAHDRYASRRNEYRKTAKIDWNMACSIGIPLVNFPLPRPEAPTLGQTGGGALSERIYYVVIEWDNGDSDSLYADTRSGASISTSIKVSAGSLLTVSIAGLTPPSGDTLVDAGTSAVLGTASHWRVYVGTEAGRERYQETVVIGTTTWTEPVGGVSTTGVYSGEGQEANVRILTARRFMRA